MPYLFTGHKGEVFAVAQEDLPHTISSSGHISYDGASPNEGEYQHQAMEFARVHCPTVLVTSPGHHDDIGTPLPKAKRVVKKSRRSVSDQTGTDASTTAPRSMLVYNEYGELVEFDSSMRSHDVPTLNVTQILRLISKAYHYEFRAKMGEVIALCLDGKSSPPGEDGHCAYADMFLWDFTPITPPHVSPTNLHALSIYTGPPRLLEIGCGDGSWCFKVKKDHPDWLVEGLDDTDHWSHNKYKTNFRDFMDPNGATEQDYFSNVHLTQETVEFTVRGINRIISHPSPIPCHMYSFIRGRDIFDKVESYKEFLDNVRCILQPEGIVEFIEIDPRPRVSLVGRRRSTNNPKTSGAETDWTDSIADRFKDPHEEQLANIAPNWTRRVEERLKATLRPRDGVPAASLKYWLEGAGFWDVKQLIIRLPVGGNTPGGKSLLDFISYQAQLEDQIQLLASDLPEITISEINFGNLYLNLHIISGRKPTGPRPGDKLLDGSRQGMSDFTYDIKSRLDDPKSTQWNRSALDAKLAMIMNNLSNFTESLAPPVSGTSFRQGSEMGNRVLKRERVSE